MAPNNDVISPSPRSLLLGASKEGNGAFV